MKTKKSTHHNACYQCDFEICKGDQYGVRLISLGRNADGPAPPVKLVICSKCANSYATNAES